MDLRNLQHNPVGFNFALFALSAAVVWLAGTRLARYGKIIAERTGAGQALVGVVLLGGTVSLPELTTTVTATSMMKSAPLAITTLLGGITFTMASLAVTDAAVGSEPLSMDVRKPVVLVQGALVTLVLTVTALGLAVGDIAVYGVGAWTTALLALYSYSVVLIKRSQYKEPWHPELPRVQASDSVRREVPPDPRDGRRAEHKSTRAIALSTIGSGAAILVAGFMLTRTADALGSQTGAGASFAGLLLGGLATSLPEISSTISAARLGQYEMAFSDAFGTNLFSTMLVFVADAIYPGGPVLNEAPRFSLVATLLAIVVTSIYMVGLLQRSKRSIARMGLDSIAVLLVTIAGFGLLYRLKEPHARGSSGSQAARVEESRPHVSPLRMRPLCTMVAGPGVGGTIAHIAVLGRCVRRDRCLSRRR
ncbi:hypothetical protein WMF39_48010 [Sorangium sp. So ce1504]|uniref:sodium:calcium antiporter n=1 Tax=Sorangium sp. So ce1504 TaxID=3133337 RepID=UPI003F620025